MVSKLLMVLLAAITMSSAKLRLWDILHNREKYLYIDTNHTITTAAAETSDYASTTQIQTFIYKPHSFFYNYEPSFQFGTIDEDLVTDCQSTTTQYCLTESHPLCYGNGNVYCIIKKAETKPCKKSKTGLCAYHPYTSCYMQYPCVDNYLYRRTEMVPCVGIMKGDKSAKNSAYGEDYCVVAYATPERKW